MDHKMKLIAVGVVVLVVLIALKFTIFTATVGSELIPGVTTRDDLIQIPSNSTLGEYILSDSFSLDISGTRISSNSEIYATNMTDGVTLYYECYNAFIAHGYEIDHEDVYEKGGRYTGVFRNETRKIIFHIFDSEEVYDHTGYSLLLIVKRGSL